jgi:folylpolyglutamate synthase/dihydropteroate synthase
MRALADALPEIAGERAPVVAVMSALGDKDVDAMAAALSSPVSEVVATRSSHARAIDSGGLADRLEQAGLAARPVGDPAAAIEAARGLAGKGGLVVICGSLYLLRDVYPLVMGMSDVSADAGGMLARAATRPGHDADRAAIPE